MAGGAAGGSADCAGAVLERHPDWISFSYQLHHGFRPKDWDWARAAVSQARPVVRLRPGIYLFGLIALAAGLREWRSRGVQLTLVLVLPVLLLFASGSGREETLPHWTALAWAAVAPLAVRWLARHWRSRAVRAGAYVSLGYSAVLIALLHSLLIYPWIAFPEGKHPLAPVTGWPEAAARAAALRGTLAAEPGPEPVLFVPNWALASQLAWYARPLPVQVTDERFDQFDLWFGTPAAGARAGAGGAGAQPQGDRRRPRPVRAPHRTRTAPGCRARPARRNLPVPQLPRLPPTRTMSLMLSVVIPHLPRGAQPRAGGARHRGRAARAAARLRDPVRRRPLGATAPRSWPRAWPTSCRYA
ncbi:MAG: hypothetical protein MZV65_21350 [Chromatiales bacterium]|nr:hypothetical protein [Chromatiales bacterium]